MEYGELQAELLAKAKSRFNKFLSEYDHSYLQSWRIKDVLSSYLMEFLYDLEDVDDAQVGQFVKVYLSFIDAQIKVYGDKSYTP